jgi:transcriptional regulator with XRE-family HTH domain
VPSRYSYDEARRHLGRNLERLRVAAGYSIEAFADRLLMPVWLLRGIEEGQVTIEPAQLLRAADILDIGVSQFFHEAVTH